MKQYKFLLFLLPALLFAGILFYAVYNALAIYASQEMEQEKFEELRERVLSVGQEAGDHVGAADASGDDGAPGDGFQSNNPYRVLQERNSDFVGWLKIEDSKIDYPVMKSAEPEYYLRRDFDGNDSSSGCLFIGGGCDEDSDCFVIYGHKMNNNSMFGTLDSYAEYDYASTHSEIRFSTPSGERIYKVFAAFRTKIYQDRNDLFQYYDFTGDLEEEEYQYTVESVRTLSIPRLPDAPSYPAQILFLSTCSYHTEDGRFVVAAYRTEL